MPGGRGSMRESPVVMLVEEDEVIIDVFRHYFRAYFPEVSLLTMSLPFGARRGFVDSHERLSLILVSAPDESVIESERFVRWVRGQQKEFVGKVVGFCEKYDSHWHMREAGCDLVLSTPLNFNSIEGVIKGLISEFPIPQSMGA